MTAAVQVVEVSRQTAGADVQRQRRTLRSVLAGRIKGVVAFRQWQLVVPIVPSECPRKGLVVPLRDHHRLIDRMTRPVGHYTEYVFRGELLTLDFGAHN